jgi:hypothetical protein
MADVPPYVYFFGGLVLGLIIAGAGVAALLVKLGSVAPFR